MKRTISLILGMFLCAYGNAQGNGYPHGANVWYNDVAFPSIAPASMQCVVMDGLDTTTPGMLSTQACGVGTVQASPQFQLCYFDQPGTNAHCKGTSSITTDGSGSLATGKTNGTLEVSSCYSTHPATWCPAAGSTLDAVLQSAFTALPNGGKIHIAASSTCYTSKDWTFPQNQTPNISWEIWGDGRSTCVQMLSGSTYWVDFTNTQGNKIHDLSVYPVAGMTAMVHLKGANQDSVYDSYLGFPTTSPPATSNTIDGYWFDATNAYGNYQNIFHGNTLEYLGGAQLLMTDSSTDGTARNNTNSFYGEWWNGQDISGTFYGTGINTDSGRQNNISAYIQNDATCMQTSIGSTGTQFFGNSMFIACDPVPPTSKINLTGSFGNRIKFAGNVLSGMNFASFLAQGQNLSDQFMHVDGTTSGGNNNLELGETNTIDASSDWFRLPAITVGASPFTWTNGTGATVRVDVSDGTVSNITVNGVQVATQTGWSGNVPSGQAVVVTYTSAPTVDYQEPYPRIAIDTYNGVCYGDGFTSPTLCVSADGSANNLFVGSNQYLDSSGNFYLQGKNFGTTDGTNTIIWSHGASGSIVFASHGGSTIGNLSDTGALNILGGYSTAGGHTFSRHDTYSASLSWSAAAANTCAVQSATVTGLQSGDFLRVIPPSITAHVSMSQWYVSAANTVSVNVCGDTTGGTPASGTYSFDVEK